MTTSYEARKLPTIFNSDAGSSTFEDDEKGVEALPLALGDAALASASGSPMYNASSRRPAFVESLARFNFSICSRALSQKGTITSRNRSSSAVGDDGTFAEESSLPAMVFTISLSTLAMPLERISI